MLVHYVWIDHDSRAVVLSGRGTLSLSDMLVDLTCKYEPIGVNNRDPNAPYLLHAPSVCAGNPRTSMKSSESSIVQEVIKQALVNNPSYGLIITGNSLGGGSRRS
ncbi:hypothetical protein PTTG_01922 [Puccinia triticina 1-1 BBBD Race 1]|uniref:sn-1-specific diacylglycerol lipase n=2 Tax=Puccinia triticina TaxID=208348 RepID=A0A0C4EMD2_PUCT1|nr:uncharacterized protein PtA15_1A582 [Puccinia triticina]XP_053023418.1 uncharacterized protein PtA15_8A770 [Puccinia triticina]OAV97613.1 hypothetical protein PTTG_01922 [Puccinia triticina 1-1 BBBD Race 1]WAQ81242.1 hypothetical protein PtA15_1A582 [Puccinia triticina]WAQ87863.1 hypothetical protein PtA15_8A770 [Puccinia triticina]WAR57742.1 hypothetical protein PtB15_8B795 [Puccinia triticina]